MKLAFIYGIFGLLVMNSPDL